MIKKILLCLMLTLSIAACSSEKTVQDPGAAFKGQSEEQIFNGAQKALKKGDYPKAIKHYEALDTLYPFGKYAQQAQINSIYAYYEDDDFASTIAAADRYIHLYPMDQHVDYAYYMRGLSEFYQNRGFLEKYVKTDFSQRDLSALRQSFLDFSQLVYRFPKSQYTPDARSRMIYIRNLIAMHILETGQFYYNRTSYVASANRANQVIRYYQQTIAVPQALDLLTKSYIKLAEYPAAARALNVLQLNYPDYPTIPQLRKQLAQVQQVQSAQEQAKNNGKH